MFDLTIKGGTVVDGTGSTSVTADIGIKDGVITEIGRVSGASDRVVDADGAFVLPGWIDAHTHYDGQVTWDDYLEGSASNGVTTIVMGNCGVGFAPVPKGGVDALIDLMEGVEDIPGTALYEGMPWGQWESFPEYLEFLDQRQWTVDVSAQLAHGALRHYVMGQRAIEREQATEDDLVRMKKITEESVAAGAVGFSTSRIIGHKSMSGYCVPGTFAHEDELKAIADGMKKGGGAVLQVIPASSIGQVADFEPEHTPLLDEVEMLGRLSRDYGLRVVFSTFQNYTEPGRWRDVLNAVAIENGRGSRLAPMVAPRAGTTLTTLKGYHPFMRRPTYMKLADLPHDQLVQKLRQPEIKSAILSEQDIPHPNDGAMENLLPAVMVEALEHMFRMSHPLNYEPTMDQSLASRSRDEGREPIEYLYDFLLEENGCAIGVALAANYMEGNLDVCREMLLDQYTVTGLSDAGAHVNFICDMAIPTFNLIHWVRDRSRGERLPIELVVQKCTQRPAHLFGLTDRGTLEVGKRADINVVDLNSLETKVPEMRTDLPAGGSRFLQLSTGYVATLNNGQITREHDKDTGARPGRVARPSR